MKTSSNRQPSTTPRPPNPPSLIEYKNMRFLVFDAPSDQNLDFYVKELTHYHVTDVVRVCEPTYDKTPVESAGIKVHDWAFTDENNILIQAGEAPPQHIVNDWLSLVQKKFESPTKKSQPGQIESPPTIGVHCVAGLGRAPVLVAMALIEGGMAPLDSVIYIRERRRGAINNRQLKYLEAYKKKAKEKACIIS